jgi:hypothetical protein
VCVSTLTWKLGRETRLFRRIGGLKGGAHGYARQPCGHMRIHIGRIDSGLRRVTSFKGGVDFSEKSRPSNSSFARTFDCKALQDKRETTWPARSGSCHVTRACQLVCRLPRTGRQTNVTSVRVRSHSTSAGKHEGRLHRPPQQPRHNPIACQVH